MTESVGLAPTDTARTTLRCDWAASVWFFAATASVVLWQNSRLAVLWDLSYVLDSATRISLGQAPYRDFPFVHPPLTFLIQAVIVKLAGRVYWPHITYCAVVGGLSTAAAWRIVLNVLRERITHARLVAFLLCLPATVLGVYSVFPHPFYDPDCAAAILASLLLLQGMDHHPHSVAHALAAGVSIIIPVFIKQNIGIAFLAAASLALAFLAIIEIVRERSARRYLLCLVGMTLALIAALACLQVTVGLDNYWRWTVVFAAARRLPAAADMWAIYSDPVTLAWLALCAAGVILARLNRGRSRALEAFGALAVSAPFVWAAASLWAETDPSDHTERLLGVWPFALMVGVLSLGLNRETRPGVSQVMPLIIIAVANGAFLSQQLWGSTYAIWPFLIILVACALGSLARFLRSSSVWMPIMAAGLASGSLLIAGASYVGTHMRLNYAQVDDGSPSHATVPELRGLTLRGQQVPDFEELMSYARANIPRDEGVVLIPGEDPFYFATGRLPRYPVLLFDRTTNPFSVEELARQCLDRQIRWLIVKRQLQVLADPVEHREQLMRSLMRLYEPVARLHNYEIYHIRSIARGSSRSTNPPDRPPRH